MKKDNLKLSLLSEISLTYDELLVLQGGDQQLEHINCGEGCGLGCGRGCGAGCSSCSEPIENPDPYIPTLEIWSKTIVIKTYALAKV